MGVSYGYRKPVVMKRYVPDIAKHGQLCEANFVRLERLLGNSKADTFEFSWHDPQGNEIDVDIEVIERFKYTTTLQLTKTFSTVPAPLNVVELTVRVYSDARMAEVVTLKQGSQLSGVYRYPNDQMYQIDEKEQANHYLAEWLSHLLSHGAVKSVWKPGATDSTED
ncbi:hypothetical protein BCF53_107176 [Reinekea marinisedimentorum]|uniref:DUF1249 domain-containing protein n=2 Tax=Reinekea marinisedimentorum TaxID=230495 RepID=A0A4R3I879_9GAMM|nr:hypothetical protein BCF53_107176 [Reinekea marinisedimentorum]